METTRKKFHRLTEDEKQEIYKIFADHPGDFTINEIADMYNISHSTVSYQKKLFNEMNSESSSDDSTTVEVVEGEDVKEDEPKKLIVQRFNPEIEFQHIHKVFTLDKFQCDLAQYKGINQEYVEVGLIDDRHPLPVKMFIFDGEFDDKLMFDYPRQEEIVQRFIDSHCKYKKKIILYTTGLQCALTSVIKVCLNNGIDIHIKHYNTETGTYQLQPLFGNISDVKPDPFEKLAKMKGGLFFYKCDQHEIADCKKKFYLIKFVNQTTNSEGHIICENFDQVWEIVPGMVKAMLSYNATNLALYVNEAYIKDDKFIFGLCFCKNYNNKSDRPIVRNFDSLK